MRRLLSPVAAVLVLGVAACQDSGSPTSNNTSAALTDAFATVPLGFGEVQSTFTTSADSGMIAWSPGRPNLGGFHDRGGMMCGGERGFLNFGMLFGLGRGFFLGYLPGTCTFNAVSGRVECDTVTRHGLTIVRSAQYKDADGNVQEAFDTLTNSVNVKIDVSGTFTRHDNDTTVVEHHSDRTVTGVARGSTSRTINSTSAGTETTTGSDTTGAFTAVRTVGDTVTDLVLSAPTDSTRAWPFPTSGTIVRAMSVTVTYDGQAPLTSSRREVITFTGGNTATIEITKDGTTKSCTLSLPHGHLSCS
ncbi:MAG TPA: hypothetical protein VG692_14220 [Gemmatimonadales bacterium]|nr:hypothetical protein [Gemmatimonadales bacterium]